jgi:hypothetical protein
MPRKTKRRKGSAKRKATLASKEIQKLLREYKRTGKMTTSRATYRPRNLEHARKIAAAIAYGKHGLGKAGARKRAKKASKKRKKR